MPNKPRSHSVLSSPILWKCIGLIKKYAHLAIGALLASGVATTALAEDKAPSMESKVGFTVPWDHLLVDANIAPFFRAKATSVLGEAREGWLVEIVRARSSEILDSKVLESGSIVDVLRFIGADISPQARRKVFQEFFPGEKYSYSKNAEQNLKLIAAIKSVVSTSSDVVTPEKVNIDARQSVSSHTDLRDDDIYLGDKVVRKGQIVGYTSSKGIASQYTVLGRSEDTKIPGIIFGRKGLQFAVSLEKAEKRIRILEEPVSTKVESVVPSPREDTDEGLSLKMSKELSGPVSEVPETSVPDSRILNLEIPSSGVNISPDLQKLAPPVSVNSLVGVSDLPPNAQKKHHGRKKVVPLCARSARMNAESLGLQIPQLPNPFALKKLYEHFSNGDESKFIARGWDRPIAIIKDFTYESLRNIRGVVDIVVKTGIQYKTKSGKWMEPGHRFVIFSSITGLVFAWDSAISHDKIYAEQYQGRPIPLDEYLAILEEKKLKWKSYTMLIGAVYQNKVSVIADGERSEGIKLAYNVF